MSDRDREWLKYALLVLAIIVAGYFGIRYPLPDMPEYVDVNGIEMQAVGPTSFRRIYVDHDATVAGVLTASSGVVGDVTGNVVGDVTGDVTGDITGVIFGSTNVISKTAAYTLTTAESGSVCTNLTAPAGGFTYTLPSAAIGLNYCFYVAGTEVITIAVPTGDQVHHITDSTGDTITNTTAGDQLCIVAIDTVYWVPTSETGTWFDAD